MSPREGNTCDWLWSRTRDADVRDFGHHLVINVADRSSRERTTPAPAPTGSACWQRSSTATKSAPGSHEHRLSALRECIRCRRPVAFVTHDQRQCDPRAGRQPGDGPSRFPAPVPCPRRCRLHLPGGTGAASSGGPRPWPYGNSETRSRRWRRCTGSVPPQRPPNVRTAGRQEPRHGPAGSRPRMPRVTCTPASSSRADSPHTGAFHPQPHSAGYAVERLPTGVDCCGAKGGSNHLPGPPTCDFDGRGHVQDVRTNLFLQVRRFVTLCGGPCVPASEPVNLDCRP